MILTPRKAYWIVMLGFTCAGVGAITITTGVVLLALRQDIRCEVTR